jgi:cephalosporin hydroxylase
MLEGSSVAPEIVSQINARAARAETVLVCLDSNHTHEHVLAELEAYAPLTTRGSYCVVFDTLIEDMPEGAYPDRPWGIGDNPKSALRAYMDVLDSEGRKGQDGEKLSFEVDDVIDSKLLITVANGGYLRRL